MFSKWKPLNPPVQFFRVFYPKKDTTFYNIHTVVRFSRYFPGGPAKNGLQLE